MQEFNPASSEWDFGFDEHGCMGRILGDPEPQARIGEFLAMVEQPDRDPKRRKIPRWDTDSALRRVDPRNGVIEASSLKDRRLEFWNNLPIRGAERIEKADGVSRSRDNAQCRDVLGSRIGIRRHAIKRRLVFSLLVEIHFKLQGKEAGSGGVRIKLVVDGEEHARGIQGVGGRAKMPRQAPEETPLLDDGRFDFGGVDGILREQNPVLQNFTRAKRHSSHGGRRSRRRFRARFGSFGFLCKNYGSARQNRPEHRGGADKSCLYCFCAIHSIWLGSKAGAPLSLRACEPGDHDIVRGARYSEGYKKNGMETSQVTPAVSDCDEVIANFWPRIA